MVSALDSRLSDLGWSLGQGTVSCSWARHFTLTVSLFTEVYKWVLANLLLGVTGRWTSIPSSGEQKYFQSLHATETGISSGTDGPLCLNADFTFNQCLTQKHSAVPWPELEPGKLNPEYSALTIRPLHIPNTIKLSTYFFDDAFPSGLVSDLCLIYFHNS